MWLNNLELVAHEWQKAARQEADQIRLIKSFQRRPSNRPRILRKVMNWTGARMVNWGCWLQAGYDAAVEPVVADCTGSHS